MSDESKSKEQLQQEVEQLRERVSEIEASGKQCNRTEEALKKSEEKLSSVLKNVSSLIMTLDRDGNILFINRTVPGLTKEQAIGKRIFDFAPPESQKTMREALKRVFENGEDVDYEIVGFGAHGEESCYQSRIEPVVEEGNVTAATLVSTDITERKRDEESLRRSEERFRTLVANIPGVSYRCLVDEHWTMLFISDEVEALSGYPASDFVQNRKRSYASIVHPEDAIITDKIAMDAVERKESFSIEYRVVRADGELRWAYERGQGIFDAQGEVAYLDGVIVDITERKQVEEALVESERRYRTVFEHAYDGMLIADIAGTRILAANPAMCAMLGYSENEILKFGAEDVLRKEDLSDVLGKFRQQASGETTFALDVPFLRKDGSVIMTDSAAALLSFGGESCIMGVFRDTTDRKKAEAATIRSSRLEATTTLAGGVAHDFNNLMVGVLGNAEFLRDDIGDRPEAADMLAAIARSARRAGELAQQLLSFARGGKYVTAPMSLNDVIQETLRLQDRTFPPRVRIERDIEPELWLAKADRAQFAQVLMSLLINAVEAIDGHGRVVLTTRNVEIEESFAAPRPGLAAGRYAYLCVEDTGCGMDSETQAKVFEPFFSMKLQGRGLGLAAVYGIVKNHGGYISVYSEPARGAAFKVYLPVTDESPVKRRKSVSNVPTGTGTVLVVDDEPSVIDVTKRMLERLGYRTLTASNGHEAVELAKNFDGDIHLAILDMGMPVMGGAEAFPLLMAARPNLKVVVCSGYELDRAAQALLDAGASAFVQKPFRRADLAPVVRAAIDGSK